MLFHNAVVHCVWAGDYNSVTTCISCVHTNTLTCAVLSRANAHTCVCVSAHPPLLMILWFLVHKWLFHVSTHAWFLTHEIQAPWMLTHVSTVIYAHIMHNFTLLHVHRHTRAHTHTHTHTRKCLHSNDRSKETWLGLFPSTPSSRREVVWVRNPFSTSWKSVYYLSILVSILVGILLQYNSWHYCIIPVNYWICYSHAGLFRLRQGGWLLPRKPLYYWLATDAG